MLLFSPRHAHGSIYRGMFAAHRMTVGFLGKDHLTYMHIFGHQFRYIHGVHIGFHIDGSTGTDILHAAKKFNAALDAAQIMTGFKIQIHDTRDSMFDSLTAAVARHRKSAIRTDRTNACTRTIRDARLEMHD